MKILIVEDDCATRMFMVKAVKDIGHEVKAAADGLEGLAVFKDFQPEIVFSDIKMPKMDGLAMLEKIREKHPDVLVIMNSTLDSPEYTLRALRLQANDYLVKPVEVKDVRAILAKYSEILTNRSRDREIVGRIYRRDLGMRIDNQLGQIGKIVNRLMQETEHRLSLQERFGIHLGLVEILTNAIEHGNLEISYKEKTRAMEGAPDDWTNLIQQRLQTEPYSNRTVNIDFRLDQNNCEWVITDEGPGFNWGALPDPLDPENLLAAHGRGVMLTRLRFDEVAYVGRGNQVRLTKHLASTF